MAKDKAPAKGKGSKSKAANKKGGKSAAPKKDAKKDEKPRVIEVDHKRRKKMLERDYNPLTGSRFRLGIPILSQQLAFDIVFENAKAKKSVKEIREILANTRPENGAPRSLDSGYFNLVVACHPEIFEVWSDGTIKLLKKLDIDKKAQNAKVKELEERQERRKNGTSKKKSKTKAKEKAKAPSKKSSKGTKGKAPAKKGGKRPPLNKK